MAPSPTITRTVKTASFTTAATGNNMYSINGASITATLAAASNFGGGERLYFYNAGSGSPSPTVTIDAHPSEMIDGASSGSLAVGEFLCLECGTGEGDEWHAVYIADPSVWHFGAQGDGTTDDEAALQEAIDATPRGGTLLIPAGIYLFTTLTRVDPMRLMGFGWEWNGNRKAYAAVEWTEQARMGGTWLLSTKETAGAALVFGEARTAADLESGMVLQDFALVGPGTGSSTGISVEGMLEGDTRNVLTTNFSIGWDFLGGNNDLNFFGLRVWACVIALQSLVFNNNVFRFYGTSIHHCTDCVKLLAGKTWHFYGGLMQSWTGFMLIWCARRTGRR